MSKAKTSVTIVVPAENTALEIPGFVQVPVGAKCVCVCAPYLSVVIDLPAQV